MPKTIEDYKKDYAAAQAKGDKAGMAAANNAAYAKQLGEENPDFDLPDSYNWVEKADAGASVGLTADEYILFDLAYSMLKSDEKEGGQTKQEKAIDLLEDMDLSNSERSYLFGTKYESDKNNPWK